MLFWNKKKRIKLLKLIEEWTRAEIMARLGDTAGMEHGDYYMKHIELKDKIRELLYDSSDLVELGYKFGILKRKSNDKKMSKMSKRD